MTPLDRSAKRGNSAGFSLLELMAVIVIVGIIATLIIYRITLSTDAAKYHTCRHNCALLNAAIERHGMESGEFPLTVGELNMPDFFPDGIPACPVTGSTYVIDPVTNRIQGHTSNELPGDH